MIGSIVSNTQSLSSYASQPPAPTGTPQPRDEVSWSKALILPGTVYTAASGTLSGLVGIADRFPAGGITINPDGIVRNPDWTRSFEQGTPLGRMQPILAGVNVVVSLARGFADLKQAKATGSQRDELAAALDFSIAAMSLAQIASPGLAGAATLALGIARFALDVHP